MIKIKKYPSIKRLGHRKTEGVFDGKLTITEKLDGNNFRTMLHEDTGRLLFGSRNVTFTKTGEYNEGKVPVDPDKDEDDKIGNQFEEVVEYLREKINKDKLKEIETELDTKIIIYGENMVKHALDYNWNKIPQFLMFDVWSVKEKKYFSFKVVRNIAEKLGLETVPLVKEDVEGIEYKEELDPDDFDKAIPESEYREGKSEGIVIRNEDNGIKAKIKTEEFKEIHRNIDNSKEGMEHMPDDDTSGLVAKYATDGRVRKHIKKLTVDGGRNLEMELMNELPMRVVDDIFEEEYEKLVRSDKNMDFKKFRSKVADKCVSLLKSEMRKEGLK